MRRCCSCPACRLSPAQSNPLSLSLRAVVAVDVNLPFRASLSSSSSSPLTMHTASCGTKADAKEETKLSRRDTDELRGCLDGLQRVDCTQSRTVVTPLSPPLLRDRCRGVHCRPWRFVCDTALVYIDVGCTGAAWPPALSVLSLVLFSSSSCPCLLVAEAGELRPLSVVGVRAPPSPPTLSSPSPDSGHSPFPFISQAVHDALLAAKEVAGCGWTGASATKKRRCSWAWE